MSQTTVITARVPAEEAEAFRSQAARHGLTLSRAVEALVAGALLAERHSDSLEAPARGQ